MKKLVKLLLIYCMCLSLILLGCSCSEETSMDQIVVGTTMEIECAENGDYNFDMLSSGVSQPPIIYQDTSGEYHPQLASYETSDSKTWVFTVLDGMKWSDGEDLKAADILLAMQSEDAYSNLYESTEISEDGKSLTLVLKEANVRFLSNMASLRPLPSHVDEISAKTLSCGPYVLEEFNKEAGSISFVRNEYYPNEANADKIIYMLFGNEDTMYMALQQGDIDMVWNYSVGTPANYQDILAASEGVQLISVSASNLPTVLGFNCSKGLFSDKNLRLAVSYALDYETMSKYLGSVYAIIPNRGLVSNATFGYAETEKLENNSAKADEYMEAAGYEKQSGFYTDQNGNICSFTLTVNSAKEIQLSAAELIKTQIESYGIKVNIESLDSSAYNAKTSNKFSENNITMEAALYGFTANGVGMQNGLASIYINGSHAVQGGCQVFDSEFDSLLNEIAAAKTMDEYKISAAKIQNFYQEYCPALALWWDSNVYAVASDFDNIVVDANFGLNNIQNWFNISIK